METGQALVLQLHFTESWLHLAYCIYRFHTLQFVYISVFVTVINTFVMFWHCNFCTQPQSVGKALFSFWISQSQSQRSQSQLCLLQQREYHTYTNIWDWNPFGFIWLMKYQHFTYRTWRHFGGNNVSTGASTEAERLPKGTAQPPQAALESFHAENIQCSQWQKGRPHDDHSAPVNNNDAKHRSVKIPQIMHNTGKCSTCICIRLQKRTCCIQTIIT